MKRVLALVSLLVLAACGVQDTADNPEPPADAPAEAPALRPAQPAPSAVAIDPAKDINALGTEPFWALQIRADTLNWSTPETPMRRGTPRGLSIQPDRVEWTATLPGGAALKATITLKSCSDGMSDRSYPFTAEVQTGGATLTGCAIYADGSGGGT